MNQSNSEQVIPRKILLMSKFNQENFKLKNILAKHLRHEVDWVRTPNQTIQQLVSGTRFDVLVINTELFTKKKLEMVKNLRAVGCDFPVIFLADIIKDTMSFVPAHLKTIVVDKPIHAPDLQGIIDRVIKRDSYAVRYHKRFNTDENADLEVFRNGQRTRAVLRNLSLGGAFLETHEIYQAGEIIKLNINLPSIQKGHELSGKIVWNSHHPDHRGVRGLGIRFIRPGEVYESAVQNLQ